MSDPGAVARPGLAGWGLIALFTTLVGLLNSSIAWTNRMAVRGPIAPWPSLVEELTGAWAFLLLLPGVLWIIERFPLRRAAWLRCIGVHLAASVAFGAAHTLLMWGSRSLLFPLLGLERYDYGLLRYRFAMEYHKQLVIYGLVVAVVSLLAHLRSGRERELRSAELLRQLSEARLAALKMQLNPHFLFNTLHLISSHVHEHPDRADAMIGHLSDFLRATLRASDVQEVPLESELEFLGSYLEIMQARFPDRLSVELSIDPDTRAALVPHLVLQPLVENAVAHTAAQPDGRGRVTVASERRGGRLRLRVEDDGPGLPDGAPHPAGSGIGLSNTAERLRWLYGDDHSLVLRNLPAGGLQVALELPFRERAVASAGAGAVERA